ncbi:ESX secretion-associated protein EspG [Pseudonocardia sp. D17]|uniref:ESX secretion-associated protein EspG n=1 Tax=Pseudonocardia sp. D17 TaxID=882661 RepID=UPI002B3DFB32|nr:hypothetical protein PSD17_24680 [Pseudonocardia sp. D17]
MSTVDWDAAAVLTLTELDVAWELAGLGEPPLELELPSPGTTVAERAHIVADATNSLARRGLAEDRRPSPWLTALLTTLARPDVSVDVRVRGRTLVGGVAARRAGAAVLAVRHRDEVAVVPIPPTRMPAAVVEVVGDVRPGAGKPVSVARVDLEAALDAGDPVTAEGGHPLSTDDELVRGLSLSAISAIMRMYGDVDRHGQIGVRVGGRRSAHVVAVHRGSTGWFARVDHRDHVTVAPVDGPDLVRRIEDLIAEAT